MGELGGWGQHTPPLKSNGPPLPDPQTVPPHPPQPHHSLPT